jgi:hypothetical protein
MEQVRRPPSFPHPLLPSHIPDLFLLSHCHHNDRAFCSCQSKSPLCYLTLHVFPWSSRVQVFAYGTRWFVILDAVAADPGCVLAQARPVYDLICLLLAGYVQLVAVCSLLYARCTLLAACCFLSYIHPYICIFLSPVHLILTTTRYTLLTALSSLLPVSSTHLETLPLVLSPLSSP